MSLSIQVPATPWCVLWGFQALFPHGLTHPSTATSSFVFHLHDSLSHKFKGDRRRAMLQYQPGQLRLLSWVVEKYWSLDTFWRTKRVRSGSYSNKRAWMEGRWWDYWQEWKGRGLGGRWGRVQYKAQLLPSTACMSLEDFGVCHPTAFHKPHLNFKVYYGSCIKVTPCYSFYIFLTHFHKNSRFPVSTGTRAHV